MDESTAAPGETAVERYLTELAGALHGLPRETAAEIHDGIAEELRGLDPNAAAARMTALGDPLFVANAARAELRSATDDAGPRRADPPLNPPSVTTGRNRGYATRGMVFATAAVVGLGSYVVPIVGWIAGVIMMWVSPVWKRWEKLLVTLAPLGIIALGFGLPWVVRLFAAGGTTSDDGTGMNPLLPPSYDGSHVMILLAVAMPILGGVFLLLRGIRRV